MQPFVHVDGLPVIAHVMRGLKAAGIRKVVVCNDRPEWTHTLRRTAAGLSATILHNDGVDSTISHLCALLGAPGDMVATAKVTTVRC
jgi:CTP:molybdopterin cytidylyltransferase MocA